MSTLLPGRATADATKAYADRMWTATPAISPNSWRILEGLTVNKLGIGTYRMGQSPAHQSALCSALTSGVNLIDTAGNYMNGESEALIGNVLHSLCNSGALSRDEVVIVSKGGYIQGDTLHAYGKTPPPDTFKLAEGHWHSLHPDFLNDRIQQARSRMGIETLDVFLLHNPEYVLAACRSKHDSATAATDAFYEKITAAFTFLEQQVQEGRIACYGVSSNTLIAPKTDPQHICLARLHEAALNAAQQAFGRRKRPMFRVIQLPFNLLEPGATSCLNTTAKTFEGTENVSTLELAARMHLAVLANRPLNAFPAAGGAFRLAEYPGTTDAPAQSKQALNAIMALEQQIHGLLGGWPNMDGQVLPMLLQHGEALIEQCKGLLHHEQITRQYLLPQAAAMQQALATLAARDTTKKEALSELATAYSTAIHSFAQALHGIAAQGEQKRLKPLRHELAKRLPQQWQEAPLQQIALNTIASMPGITCVLTGARAPDYVDDLTAIMQQGDFADPLHILGAQS